MILKKCRPLLDLRIEIPFIEARTGLMRDVWEEQITEYLLLHVRVWKWRFTIRLYDTLVHAVERGAR